MQKCRVCDSKTNEVLDLGKMYPSNFIPKDVSSDEYEKFPLVLVKCESCDLIQLDGTVELDDMYRQYWYRSGLNKSMIVDLKDVVVSTLDRLEEFDKGDVWVDIGANDCTLFSFVPEEFTKVGFDPALNLTPASSYDSYINDYFSKDTYEYKKAKVITSIAMFYDLPNPPKFVEDISEILDEDGIWVIQFTDLFSMLILNAYDTICHEHLETYSLSDVIRILEPFGLQVFDAEYNKVNGGSLRVYVCHGNRFKSTRMVVDILLREGDYLASYNGSMERFNWSIKAIRYNLLELLASIKGKKIFGLGASTKGNTLLQYVGITNETIPYILEVNEDKFGLKTIGSEIEIISERDGLAMKPDYLLALPWHFRDSLLEKKGIKSYLEKGGKLIFPLPEIVIVSKDGEMKYEWN